ncbi:hypothetical protein [Oceanospirillum sanctuarii]|uniref:hypothetical protein n=1 Tax=Oceanospirillum sanctuarii TaxID=1434821 RepID=UPI000A3B7B5D|nr:hypothetical protein [Oceanospirillum sanctuarii]
MINYFGTCRIRTPLTMLHSGNIIRLQNRWWGHLHSTKDMLQVLDYYEKLIAIPDNTEKLKLMNLSLLTLPTWKKLNPHQLPFDQVDTFFIELSSMKAYELNTPASDHPQSLVIDRLPAYFSAISKDAATWVKQLRNQTPDRLIRTGDELADQLIQHLTLRVMPPSEIKADLLLITQRLKALGVAKICFINTFNVPFNGKKLPGREELSSITKSFVAQLRQTEEVLPADNIHYFDPSAFIEEHQQHALTDAHHYHPNFLPLAAYWLNNNYQSTLS